MESKDKLRDVENEYDMKYIRESKNTYKRAYSAIFENGEVTQNKATTRDCYKNLALYYGKSWGKLLFFETFIIPKREDLPKL